MSVQNIHYQRLLTSITHDIENKFDSLGLLYRIFGRVKSDYSLQSKISNNPQKYSTSIDGKKIQDVIGIRITLYFKDDLQIAIAILKNIFEWDREASNIDNFDQNIFEAIRCNLIFKLPNNLIQGVSLDEEGYCDNTFEVQIRTVFSEGWHEVEHDLRYKHKDDWNNFDDSSRTLNGFLASLETVDWGILQLLADLSHKHYKSCNWEAMFRNKLRLRISKPKEKLLPEITDILNQDPNGVGKAFFRSNRTKILDSIFQRNISLPLTLNNLVFIINELEVKNSSISKITPEVILNKIKNN